MRKIPDFDIETREFVIYCLQHGGTIAQVRDDLLDILQLREDSDAKRTIYKRIQKIKAKLPDDETKDVKQYHLLCQSPQWRVFHFRIMLKRATDDTKREQLLRNIRTESQLIAKMSGKTTTPEVEPEAEDDELEDDYSSDLYKCDPARVPEDIKSLPNFNLDEWHSVFGGDPYPNDCLRETFLPKSEYEYVDNPHIIPMHEFHKPRYPYYRRKSDGVLVHQSSKPLTEKELKWWREKEESGDYPEVDSSNRSTYNIDPCDITGDKNRTEYTQEEYIAFLKTLKPDEPARTIYLKNCRKKHARNSE